MDLQGRHDQLMTAVVNMLETNEARDRVELDIKFLAPRTIRVGAKSRLLSTPGPSIPTGTANGNPIGFTPLRASSHHLRTITPSASVSPSPSSSPQPSPTFHTTHHPPPTTSSPAVDIRMQLLGRYRRYSLAQELDKLYVVPRTCGRNSEDSSTGKGTDKDLIFYAWDDLSGINKQIASLRESIMRTSRSQRTFPWRS